MTRKFTIRLPQPLNDWLVSKATQSERSLNRQIIFLLEKERSADLLTRRCIGNMHFFRDSVNECNCGLKVDKLCEG